jgi:hypothetical protein
MTRKRLREREGQSRRTDASPTTWEIPVGIGLIWLLGSSLTLPAGQGLAFALSGYGFVWPGPELGHCGHRATDWVGVLANPLSRLEQSTIAHPIRRPLTSPQWKASGWSLW